MNSGIYGVYDRLQGYKLIFIEDNDVTAQRFFEASYNSAPEPYKRDMELWHLGLIDTKTGEILIDDKYFLSNLNTPDTKVFKIDSDHFGGN